MNVISGLSQLKELNNKRVLFITTKNLDYIRNSQEIHMLRKDAMDIDILGSSHRYYPLRLLHVFCRLMFISYKGYDTVFAGFAPQMILPFSVRRMRRAGCNIVIDFFISLYDTFCMDRRTFSPSSIAGMILHRLDRNTLYHADRIICDTKAHGEYFMREFGADTQKLSVLYIKADPSLYRPHSASRIQVIKSIFPEMLEAYTEDHILRTGIVFYFGSILPLQGADTVYEAMTTLSYSYGYICIFIGSVDALNITHSSDIIYHRSWVAQTELSDLIDISDICIAGHFASDIDKADRTIPGKALIYEAMNKPMILGDSTANREIFTSDDRHIFADRGNPDAIVRAVMRMS